MPAKYPHVNEAVRAAVDHREVSVRDLAAMIGVHPGTVYRWLAGDDSPHPKLWPAIEAALGVTLRAFAEVAWHADVIELKARLSALEARMAELEQTARPVLRAAQGPAGSHLTAIVVPVSGPQPDPADPDDHHA